MNRFYKFLPMLAIAAFSFTGIFAQNSADKAYKPDMMPKPEVKAVRVLFTADLHSCAEKYPALTAFIKQERKAAEDGGFGVITLDGGDMAFGSLYSAFFEIDATEYRQLALAGYDAFVFGNHDFDLGLTSLAYMFYNRAVKGNFENPATKEKLLFPINITANIDADLNASGDDSKNFANALKFINHQPYVILERGGLKIGVFGLLGQNAYETSMVSGKILYEDPVETAKKVIPMMRAKGAEFIVALSHSGAMAREDSEDARLARECPEINVIISAHDHEALFQPFMVGNTAIVSAGANGSLLGEIDLVKKAGKYIIGQYELKTVPEDIAPDKGAQMLLDALKDKVLDQFGKRFHSSPFDIIDSIAAPLSVTTDSKGFNPMGYDVAKAIFNCAYFLKMAQVDTSTLVAIVPDGVLRQQIPAGKITYSDVFNSLSLGRDSRKNPGSQLILCYLTGSDLKKVCEFNASSAIDNPDTHISFYGLNYTYNSAMPKFFRVNDVYVHGKKLDKSALYCVVTDFYTASNISLAGSKSHGLLSIEPRDPNGKEILDIERKCSIHGNEQGWFLDNADISEWYAYAVYLRDKVILPDSYPLPNAADNRSNTPYLLGGAVCLLILLAIIFGIKAIRKKK